MINRRAFVGFSVLAPIAHLVAAQGNERPGVPQAVMVDTWVRFKELIDFLPRKFSSLVESERRAQLDRRLQELDRTMAEVVRQKLEISRDVFDPDFVYRAPLRSYKLSQEVWKLIALLDAIYSNLSIREEKTAKDTTAAMKALHQALFEKWRLEADLRTARTRDADALGALSRKWRTSADSVSDAREALTRARAQLNKAPAAAT